MRTGEKLPKGIGERNFIVCELSNVKVGEQV